MGNVCPLEIDHGLCMRCGDLRINEAGRRRMKSKNARNGEVFVKLHDVRHGLFDYLLVADLGIRVRTAGQIRDVTDDLLKVITRRSS